LRWAARDALSSSMKQGSRSVASGHALVHLQDLYPRSDADGTWKSVAAFVSFRAPLECHFQKQIENAKVSFEFRYLLYRSDPVPEVCWKHLDSIS
jgi:hypothetical protein